MRLAVTGAAGRMGRLVIKKAVESGINVVQAFDIVNVGKDAGELAGIGKIGVPIQDDITKLDADVLVDFTNPEAALTNAKMASEKGVKLVKEALRSQPNNIAYIDSLAWGYYKIGLCQKAYNLMKKVVGTIGTKNKEIKTHWELMQSCK